MPFDVDSAIRESTKRFPWTGVTQEPLRTNLVILYTGTIGGSSPILTGVQANPNVPPLVPAAPAQGALYYQNNAGNNTIWFWLTPAGPWVAITGATTGQEVYIGRDPAPPDDPTKPALSFPAGGGNLSQWDVGSAAWV